MFQLHDYVYNVYYACFSLYMYIHLHLNDNIRGGARVFA